MQNRLHAYVVWQHSGLHCRRIWFVASTAAKMPIARRLAGRNPNPKAAKDFRGPLRKGLVAYGRWEEQPEL